MPSQFYLSVHSSVDWRRALALLLFRLRACLSLCPSVRNTATAAATTAILCL